MLRFRLSRHQLVERLPPDGLDEATALCGIQETPRRTAVVALHARVEGVTRDGFERALKHDKRLLLFWAMRGAPYLVPSDDAPVFATGSLPADETSWRSFFGGWATSLSEAGATLPQLVDQAAEVAAAVLDGHQLPVDEVRQAMAERMPAIQGLQRPAGAHADLPEPLYRALGPRRVACIVDSRRMTDATIARTDQWLGEPLAGSAPDPEGARDELLRRFLRCYGPSTPQGFAQWTARSPADVRTVFDAIGGDLAQVRVEGSTEWLLASDLDALASPPRPTGVRLLPPQDPFLQQRDRERLLPDKEQRRRLWRPVGGPGLVLVDGEPAGVWNAQVDKGTLNITVNAFVPLSARDRRSIAAEADSLAPLRGAEQARVTFADGAD